MRKSIFFLVLILQSCIYTFNIGLPNNSEVRKEFIGKWTANGIYNLQFYIESEISKSDTNHLDLKLFYFDKENDDWVKENMTLYFSQIESLQLGVCKGLDYHGMNHYMYFDYDIRPNNSIEINFIGGGNVNPLHDFQNITELNKYIKSKFEMDELFLLEPMLITPIGSFPDFLNGIK